MFDVLNWDIDSSYLFISTPSHFIVFFFFLYFVEHSNMNAIFANKIFWRINRKTKPVNDAIIKISVQTLKCIFYHLFVFFGIKIRKELTFLFGLSLSTSSSFFTFFFACLLGFIVIFSSLFEAQLSLHWYRLPDELVPFYAKLYAHTHTYIFMRPGTISTWKHWKLRFTKCVHEDDNLAEKKEEQKKNNTNRCNKSKMRCEQHIDNGWNEQVFGRS